MRLVLVGSLSLLIIWCLSAGFVMAGTFFDDFSDDKLDEKWFVTMKRATRKEIVEADGILTFDSKGTDVVTGIRYDETFDLTQGDFILECDYITGYQQTYISFNSFPSTTEAWDNKPMFIFIIVNGDYQFCCPGGAGAEIDKQFHYQVGQVDWHHYKIEFNPPTDKKMPFSTTVDKGEFEAKGTIDIGDIDPKKVYLYFEVWTPAGTPAYLDNVSFTSPSIKGNFSVDRAGKLAAFWGMIKI